MSAIHTNPTSTGKQAEQVAAEYLQHEGYKILDMNWKTRWCEIDIVANKAGVIYFVEVKYRIKGGSGTGVDYITPIKLKQMKFAAENWVNQNNWPGEYTLSAISLSGDDYQIDEYIEEI